MRQVGDAGRDAEVDQRDGAAGAQAGVVLVLGEGQRALGVVAVHVGREIDGVDPERLGQAEHGPVEGGVRGVDQEPGVGEQRRVGRVAREHRRELGHPDEVDAVEVALGVEQRVLGRVRLADEDQEADRDAVALAQLGEAGEHGRAHRAETEEHDQVRRGAHRASTIAGAVADRFDFVGDLPGGALGAAATAVTLTRSPSTSARAVSAGRRRATPPARSRSTSRSGLRSAP